MSTTLTIVGAGLAGSEAALQLAGRGWRVRLLEQKPLRRTPAQTSDDFCELVCSNSLRGAALTNAVGLLKEEMRRLGSHVMQVAEATRVPAGGALAVDRERFARGVTERLRGTAGIEVVAGEVTTLPEERPLIVATGPLTGDALAEDLARRLGTDAIAYYDAIAPIISAESIDWDEVFVASRYDKGEGPDERRAYVNCPLSRELYERFVDDLLAAEQVPPREFEVPRYFEGCLPIEVMAERGRRTLSFGPMKAVGLVDPRTGLRPWAVVQLRREDEAGTAYNLVGFQTRMKRADQERVLRSLPGLRRAEFLRYGAIHRNTFVDAPRLLGERLEVRGLPGVYLAGQLAGTEGYVESAACGWLVADALTAQLEGVEWLAPPATTAHGGLLRHLLRLVPDYQPSNITFAHLAPWEGPRLGKRERYAALAERALRDLDAWRTAALAQRGAAQREPAQSQPVQRGPRESEPSQSEPSQSEPGAFALSDA